MEIINITDEIIEVNVTEAVVNVVTQNGAYPLPSNVFSVFGRVGNVVGQIGDYTTSIVEEGTNLYYTQARFDTAFGNKTTTDLDEGTNLYYTDARSRAAISENITGLEYSSASGIFSLASGYVIPTQAMLDAKVPYTGATGNVNLGEYQLSAGQVTFDQTPTGAAGVGVMRWNDTDGTLDLGLKGGNVTLQIGQEQVKRVVNGTGINLTEAAYQVVKVSGAQGQRLQVTLAQANNDLNSATTLGIVTENINNNQEGFITTSGEVRGINTTGSLQGETWTDGDILYLSPTTAGKITNIKPVAPNHMVIVGFVEYAHQNNGKIFVKVDNGYELDELHNVKITTPLNNQALIFDSTDSVWKNESLTSALGYTPVPTTRTISTTAPLTGGGDLSADRTISMPAATTSVSGYLTSTDWNTFNNKEGAITAGTTAQYYRGDKTFQTLDTLAVAENTNLYYTQARFDTAFSGKSTTNLAEGTNLYFTTARAQAAISGTAPIDVSGGVVSISQASGSSNGYLSSTDWNTFNGKQNALNGTGFVKISGTTISYDNSTYLTTISGITAGGELSGTYPNPTLVNSAVTGKVLTGLNLTGGGTIADTDSILNAFGKVQNQISALVGGVMYEGTWDASTNTPTIVSSVGSKGDYYIVSVAGSTNINGITSWNIGDWIIFNGTTWDKVDNTDAVSSVNGYTGAVSLVTSDVAESGNLYFTNDRAIGSTLTGYTSGAGTISSSDSILQAIQKLNGNVSGLVTGVSSVFGRTGAVVAASGDYTTTQVTEGTNLYYTEGRVSANTDVAANTAARHAAVTLGTANGLSLAGQALSLGLSSGSATGALSSTDWNTFNNKQAALNGTGFVKISGTTITYDNSTYLTTSSAASTYLPLTGGTLTGPLSGTSATFSGAINLTGTANSFQVASIFRNANRVFFGGDTGGYFFQNSGNTATVLQIADTGAATFSNQVTALMLQARPTSNVNAPSLGAGAGPFFVSSANQLYGLYGGTSADGHSWLQNTRNDGTAVAYPIALQPSGGNVGIGTSSPNLTATNRTTLDINGTSTAILGFSVGGTAKSYLFQTGTDFIMTNLAAAGGGFIFENNGAERMRITSGGRIGIATSSPYTNLHIKSGGNNLSSSTVTFSTSGTSGLLLDQQSNTNNYGSMIWFNNDELYAGIGGARPSTSNWGTELRFYTHPDSTTNQYDVTERMRITSGGDVAINNTFSVASKLKVKSDGTTSGSYACIFWDSNASDLMYVRSDGYSYLRASSWVYGSDLRMKENISNVENGLDMVLKMKPKHFDYIDGVKNNIGFIAQDIQEIIPEAVSITNKKTGMLGLKTDFLVPVLVKAIQEQQQQIEELKALIAAKYLYL